MESEHARFLVVLLLCLTVAPSLLGVASAQSVLGQTRNLSLVYSLCYQGSLRTGGLISFVNTFYNPVQRKQRHTLQELKHP